MGAHAHSFATRGDDSRDKYCMQMSKKDRIPLKQRRREFEKNEFRNRCGESNEQ